MKQHDYTRLGGFLFLLQFSNIVYLILSCLAASLYLFGVTTDFGSTIELVIDIAFCIPTIYMLGTADPRFRTFYWIVTAAGAFYRLALVLVVSYAPTQNFYYLLGNLFSYSIIRGLILLYLYRSKRAAVYFHFVGPVLCSAEFGNEPVAHTPVSVPNELPLESSSDPTPAAESPKAAPGHCHFRFFPSMSPERRAFLKGILCTLLILLLVVGGFFGVQAYQTHIRSVYDDGFIDGLKTGYDQGVAASSPDFSSIYRRAYKSGFLDSQQGNPYDATPPASIS